MMPCNIWEWMKSVTWLLIIIFKMGHGSEYVRGRQEIQAQSTVLPTTRPQKVSSQSRFWILPKTTWKKATEICLMYDSHLLLANDLEVMEKELLPLMDTTDFIWISVKDYGLNCRNETAAEFNLAGETVCDSYIRVSLKPSTEKLKYGLCSKSEGVHGQKMEDPVTWTDMKNRCIEIGGDLYQFSTVEEVQAMLSILRPNQTRWTRNFGNQDFPEFGPGSKTKSVCIGMVKLVDTFIYMADDCNRMHNFVCEKDAQEYAPAVEALEKATTFYTEDNVEKATTHATNHPHPTQTGGANSDQTEELAKTGIIVGSAVAGVVVIVTVGLGLYCYLRIHKAKAYWKKRTKIPRATNNVTGTGDMSLNDDQILPSSDSFWEVGKFMRAVNRIDNGHALCSQLRQLINSRAEIEKSYAKQLAAWSKKWNETLDKGPEYGTTQGAWRGVLEEADKLSELHTEVGEKLVNNVTVSIKQWQKENYHKSMMHFKETKDMENQFRKAQKPWEKKLNKVVTAKKDYHNACRQEKSTANQENNARGDSSFSPDQLKKLQEKLKKCQADVEATHDKYNACLNDLNGYNAKYIEDMNEVFDKCQDFERKRIDFVKKIMFDIHQCLDLSVDPRYSQVYTDLHRTISNTDADKDLKWWSDNHGADMPMAWPVFEEYSPELKSISQKKSSQISQGGEGGITITSIKHSTDNFVPSGGSGGTGNRNSQNSQKNESYSYNNTDTTMTTTAITERQNDTTPRWVDDLRQDSYDESLNPFGGDENVNAGETQVKNAQVKTNPSTSDPNPFGDPDSGDEHASQGSGSGSARKSPEPGAVLSIPARVIYAYVADEDDEISAEAGDVITRLSDQDDMGWIKAINKQGVRGLIPGSYIEDI